MHHILRNSMFALAAGVMALAPGVAAAEIPFKCSTGTVNDVQHQWCNLMVEKLAAATNGQLKGEVFPAAQLGVGTQQMAGVQLGTIEMYMTPPEFLIGVDRRFMVLTSPYLFDDADHAYRVLNDAEFTDQFLSLGDEKGFKGISLLVYGPVGIAAREPIRTPDDLKGKKLRINATPIEQAMMNAFGASGVPMGLIEAITAIQQGVVDAVQSGLPAMANFKMYDAAPYHSNTHHFFITSIGVVSQRWFEGLPQDVQEAIVKTGREVHEELLEFTKQANEKAIENWKSNTKDGWIELTAEERAAFRERVGSADTEVIAQNPEAKDLIELLRKKSAEHK